ncbi:hypothetical protein VOLCADRAFT_95650 [Volvox carteri f. nagariensis]|uniref:Uncharacterized protein n=1 Tax=Volvox carteri f. nagariensis TaxID=3068 RepID=D8U7W2_VOLCA|nr:uncharacterized protein VOLCADRAFT_95650 [Volvox carteri f. nagariensis]EFJ44215.1 hypothetical protein VOLCADRAFT_95650 [Volvox carteri f. nagariensis]|eukprot:XP_002954809.1 hypothetical protein VOLCADRAFT_95650 [Volvox carteri f. nagariensis]
MGTMTAPVGPTFLSVPLDVLVNRDLDKNGRELLETLHKTSAATSTTVSADMLLEPASKKQKLQSEPPVDSAEAALLRAGRKKPPWTPTEQAVVAIKHCELGNRWTQIAAYLPLRSENDVKNIWHSTLRCKDTQKRSFLRTYALAVHDHAYDYATRKAMFDIAHQQQQQHDADVMQEGDEQADAAADVQRKPSATTAAAHGSANKPSEQCILDVRRLLQSREKYGSGKYGDMYGDAYIAMDRIAAEEALASELEHQQQQQQQQRTHLPQLQGPQSQAPGGALRNQPAEALDSLRDNNNNSDSGVSALRHYNATAMQAAGNSSGGGATAPAAAGFPAPPTDSLLANMVAAAAAATAAEASAGGAAAAAGDAHPGASRQPGAQLPAINNLLALLYKYNIEQSQVAGKPLGTGGWSGSGGEEEDGAPGATMADSPTAAGGGAGSDVAAAAAVASTTAEGEEERGSAKAAAPDAPTTMSMMAGSQGAQPLTLRPLTLRPLQAATGKRDRDGNVKEEDEGAEGAMATGGERSAEDSPKRPASARVAARRANQGAACPPSAGRDSVVVSNGDIAAAAAAVFQPGALRSRGSMPYSLQDADADELGAVEALALAARLNTSNGRTPGGAGPTPGRSSGSSLGPPGNGAAATATVASGGDVGRMASTASAAAAANAAAAAAGGGPGSFRNGAAPGIRASTTATAPGAAVLDLHNRPPAVASQPQPPLPARSLTRHSAFGSDAEASVLLLVAIWLQANKEKITLEQARAVCAAVRLAALGGFYLSAVLPQLLTEPRVGPAAAKTLVGSNARPGGRWFEMRHEELAFLTRYVHAGAAERALLADVARSVYDCSLPWYDMSPRYLGSPAEGFCFEWHIPDQGLRDALSNGTQPHAAFTVNDDISDSDGGGPDGSVAVVPYILCRGLEWHVFVDCQQQRRGGGGGGTGPGGAGSSSVAGVFVYCRVPAALRAPGATTSGFVGVVPGAGIRLGVHGWRCGRLEEVFVWTFGDETYFVPDAGMGCPSALPLRKRPASPPGATSARGGGGGAAAAASGADPSTSAWADYLHEGGLRGTLTFLPH